MFLLIKRFKKEFSEMRGRIYEYIKQIIAMYKFEIEESNVQKKKRRVKGYNFIFLSDHKFSTRKIARITIIKENRTAFM